MRIQAALLAVLVVAAAVAVPATAAVTTQSTDAKAYSGTHVSYDVDGDAIVNYSVGGETMIESMAIESASEYESRTGASGSVSLGAVADLDGLGLEMSASSNTEATVETSGSSKLVTHDNGDGTFVVESGDGEQLVEARLGSDGNAEAVADDRVVVESANGSTGTFIVVGDGNVTVNEDGNVAAKLDDDARLVFRGSGEDRSEDEEHVERMIANGTATAEVYAGERDGEVVQDTVTYGQNTTVEAAQESENTVDVTVERSKSQGKVVVTHVSAAAVGTVDSLNVTVDGEAAAQAESYSALQAAANGGDEAKYFVAQQSSAEAEGSATVLVGFDHFSERSASISGEETSTDDGSTGAEDGSADDGSGMPGFGVTAALVALVAASAVAFRTRA